MDYVFGNVFHLKQVVKCIGFSNKKILCDLIIFSECGNISLPLATFAMFAVPNVNKMIVLGVCMLCMHKMSMESNLVLAWHIQSGRLVFSSFSCVVSHTYLLSWNPNKCWSHSLVLSVTCRQSRCKLLLHFCQHSNSFAARLLTSFPTTALSIPILNKQKHTPFFSHLPPLLSARVWSLVISVLSPFHVSVPLRCHWENQ